jgi:hypothetical protein
VDVAQTIAGIVIGALLEVHDEVRVSERGRGHSARRDSRRDQRECDPEMSFLDDETAVGERTGGSVEVVGVPLLLCAAAIAQEVEVNG